MSAQTFTPDRPAPSLARRLLLLDGLTCAAGGAVALIGAGPLATFLGLAEAAPLALIGGALAAYGAFLAWRARRDAPVDGPVRAVIAINVAWVVASALLIAANPLDLSVGGRWLLGLVAALVADLALAQGYALRRAR